MLDIQPSRTALAAATHRAVHQILEGGRIFRDPLALAILGLTGDTAACQRIGDDAEADPLARRMRLFIAFRTRFAEEALAEAVERRQVRQLVVLGAGLDTFAYRSPLVERLAVFEVDHPATQAWKRARLGAAGIAPPPSLAFVPCDFERQALGDALRDAGFDPRLRTFFTWMGVVPYLSAAAIEATLSFVAALPGGGEIVFDYGEPPASRPAEERAAYAERAARVAALGERWISFFMPGDLAALLRRLGFAHVGDATPADLAARYLGARQGPAASSGGAHMVHAASA